MPTGPGVYLFKNASDKLLYVGKSKSIRSRVRSYFAPPIGLSVKTSKLVSQIQSVEYIEVASELESLLLESRLIKKFQPPYNIASRDDKSPYYIHITREEYPKPVINHEPASATAGPFLNRIVPNRILRQLRRVAPFCLSPRPVKTPCLYSHIGLCRPCPAVKDLAGYLRNIQKLRTLLRGKFKPIKKELAQSMQKAAASHDFETASVLRDRLHNLERLLSAPIPPDFYIANPNLIQDRNQEAVQSLLSALALNSILRIEFFDNSHLSGTSPASAMTVAVDGKLISGQYRHFTLQNRSSDDVASMAEVLNRRLKHSDWPRPDLIVLDGGQSQLSAIRNTSYVIRTPIIALSKSDRTIHFPDGRQLNLPKNHPGLLLLVHLSDEAHRFSRRLHHRHRSKKLVN